MSAPEFFEPKQTLRDWFASQALTRIPFDFRDEPHIAARRAYLMADAMLAARKVSMSWNCHACGLMSQPGDEVEINRHLATPEHRKAMGLYAYPR